MAPNQGKAGSMPTNAAHPMMHQPQYYQQQPQTMYVGANQAQQQQQQMMQPMGYGSMSQQAAGSKPIVNVQYSAYQQPQQQ